MDADKKELQRERVRKWFAAHPDYMREYRSRIAYKLQKSKADKQYYQAHRAELLERMRIYREKVKQNELNNHGTN